MALREWLMESERMLWSAIFMPFGLLGLTLVAGLVASFKRGGRWVRRSAWWAIPALIAFILYYGWLLDASLVVTVGYAIVGTSVGLAWIFALDAIRPGSPLVMRLFRPVGAKPIADSTPPEDIPDQTEAGGEAVEPARDE